METSYFDRLPLETPEGSLLLDIYRTVLEQEDGDMQATLRTVVQGREVYLEGETTEQVLLLLAKSLPQGWQIRSCLSCRHGHFCPTGDCDNELFCVTDFAPQSPRDLWAVTEHREERARRSRSLFHTCGSYSPQEKGFFTYSDYLDKIHA